MATARNRKPTGKAARPATGKAKAKVARGGAVRAMKVAKATRKAVAKAKQPAAKQAGRVQSARSVAKPSKAAVKRAKPIASRTAALAPAKRGTVRPASVRSAARAVAAARAAAPKRRAPSYIPRSSFNDDWLLSGPVELPRQPNPAAHAPVRKPPKPRAPKPKAISHEQAVANLKALLESRKRKGAAAAKNA